VSIVGKIRWLIITLVLATALTLGCIVYLQFDAMTAELQHETLRREVHAEAERVAISIRELQHDIQWLAGYSNQIWYSEGDDHERDHQFETLKTMCLYLMEAKPVYDQVRIIGGPPEGVEALRVNRVGDEVVVVPDSMLQVKGHRDYYQNALAPGAPKIAFSRINLNVEHGVIEVPYKPTIRAVGLLDESVRKNDLAVAVINMDFGRLMKLLESESRLGFDLLLCSGEGDYLMNPDESKVFGFDLGHRYRIQDDYEEVAAFIEGEDEDFMKRFPALSTSRGDLLCLYRFHPYENNSSRALIIGTYARYDKLLDGTWSIALRSATGILLMVILGILGAWYLGRRVTSPLSLLSRAVVSFGERQKAEGHEPPLPLNLNDELGDLARAFEAMRQKIFEREASILELNDRVKSAHEELAYFAHVSSHELREPVKRIASLSRMIEEQGVEWDEADREGLVEHLNHEVEAVLGQLNSFRHYVQVTEKPWKPEKCPMGELVREALEPFMREIKHRSGSVELGELPVLSGNWELLSGMFSDLFDNALKYSHGNGLLIRVQANQTTKGRWILSVENSHASIPEKEWQRVFQPFLRLDKSVPGSGMGLTVARQVMRRHGGSISLRSEGEFVIIELEFPV